ncbi:MAG: hypothetical protein M5U01_29000 [Ardenticatenaceae bacterium]|nr:hypothetical protein [Ardenticatenaceae bacterium]HBY98046.1 hypothetical protein [Chloroflexota bacterium]
MKITRYLYVAAVLTALLVVLGAWRSFPNQAKEANGRESPPPKFEVDPFWPKPLPNNWVTGEVAATCVDSQDHLFIVSRRNLTAKELRVATPSPAIIEFDPAGNVVNSATPPVLPDGLHGCFVDYQDNLWIGGNGDAIVQKYSHDLSTLLLQIGEKGHFDSTDGTAAGTPLNSSHTLLNRPSDIAVDPTNGDVYISDGYGNHRVVVFDHEGNYLRQWGEAATQAEADDGVGGKFLATVHGVNIGQDGLVYVNDRKGDRIQVFEKTGDFVRNIWIQKGVGINNPASIGTAWDMAFSPDRSQTFIYDTDGEQEILWIVGRESGELLAGFGRSGHMAGEFTFLHTVAADSKGNLYTGETIDGRRVQKFKAVGRQP